MFRVFFVEFKWISFCMEFDKGCNYFVFCNSDIMRNNGKNCFFGFFIFDIYFFYRKKVNFVLFVGLFSIICDCNLCIILCYIFVLFDKIV